MQTFTIKLITLRYWANVGQVLAYMSRLWRNFGTKSFDVMKSHRDMAVRMHQTRRGGASCRRVSGLLRGNQRRMVVWRSDGELRVPSVRFRSANDFWRPRPHAGHPFLQFGFQQPRLHERQWLVLPNSLVHLRTAERGTRRPDHRLPQVGHWILRMDCNPNINISTCPHQFPLPTLNTAEFDLSPTGSIKNGIPKVYRYRLWWWGWEMGNKSANFEHGGPTSFYS